MLQAVRALHRGRSCCWCSCRDSGGLRGGDAAGVRAAGHHQEVPLPGRLRGTLGAALRTPSATALLVLTQVPADCSRALRFCEPPAGQNAEFVQKLSSVQ